MLHVFNVLFRMLLTAHRFAAEFASVDTFDVSAYLVCHSPLNFSHAEVLVSVTCFPSALVDHLECSHSFRNGRPDGVWFVCFELHVPLTHSPHVCPVPGCFLVFGVDELMYFVIASCVSDRGIRNTLHMSRTMRPCCIAFYWCSGFRFSS